MVWPIIAKVGAGLLKAGRGVKVVGTATKALGSRAIQAYQRRRLLRKLSPKKKWGIGAALGAGLTALLSRRSRSNEPNQMPASYNNNVVNSNERPHYGRGNLGINALIAISIIFHIADGWIHNYSIEPGAVGFRLFLYFVLGIITTMLLKENKFFLLREVILLGIFIVFLPALIYYGIGLIPGAEFAAEQIAMFILLFPFWTIYLVYFKAIQEPLLAKVFYWYMFWILIIFLFNGLLIFSQTASELPTGNIRGIDYQETLRETRGFITDTTGTFIQTAKDYYEIILTGGEQLINQTLGREYQSEIEYSRHRTGVFLENFGSNRASEVRNFGQGQRVILPVTLRASSFRDEGMKINFKCEATHLSSGDKVLSLGIAEVELRSASGIGGPVGAIQRIINCEFEPGSLNVGRHRVELTAEFDFSTWGYTPHYFVDAETLWNFEREIGNWNNRYRISSEPKTVVTNAPVNLGTSSSSFMPIPVPRDEDTQFGVRYGATNIMNPTRTTGQIKSINSFLLKLPQQMVIDQATCNQGGLIQENADVPGFISWRFTETTTSLPFELSCNIRIPQMYSSEFVTGESDPVEVTIASAIEYTYELRTIANINIEEGPLV